MSEVAAAPATPTTNLAPNETKVESQPTTSQNETNNQVPQNETKTDAARRKYKYKADGKEVEEELDDNELSGRLSFAKAADKRMKEAAEQRRAVEDLMKRLKENPLDILNDERVLGSKKFREIAENYLVEQLKLEQMTPEQRAQMDRDKRLQEYEVQEQKRREAEEGQKNKSLEDHYQKQYEQTIIEALQSSGLPKNEITVGRIASLMKKSIKVGLDLDAKYLASAVRREIENELKTVAGAMEPEQLLALFGDDMANKIRKHDLSKWAPKNPVSTKRVAPVETKSPANLSPREFKEQLRARFQK